MPPGISQTMYEAGLTRAVADTIYLRLDASNDPITGDLQINANLNVINTYTAIAGNNFMVDFSAIVNPTALSAYNIRSLWVSLVDDAACAQNITGIFTALNTYCAHQGTGTISNIVGFQFEGGIAAGGGNATSATAGDFQLWHRANAPSTMTIGYAISPRIELSGGGTITTGYCNYAFIGVTSGTIGTFYGYYIDVDVSGAAAVMTTGYGIYVRNPTVAGGGTITDWYPLYIENPTTAATNHPAIFRSEVNIGDAANYSEFLTDGDLIFYGTAGLCFGEIYAHSVAAAITSVNQNDWDQITAFDTNGLSNNTTPDHTNDHITISKAGKYLISFHWCGHGPAAVHDWDFYIAVNNRTTTFNNITAHVTSPIAQNDTSVSATGIANLSVNDTVELWVTRTSAGNNIVLTTDNCNITITQIGG